MRVETRIVPLLALCFALGVCVGVLLPWGPEREPAIELVLNGFFVWCGGRDTIDLLYLSV